MNVGEMNRKTYEFETRIAELDDILAYYSPILRGHCRRVGTCTAILAEERADDLIYMYDFKNAVELSASVYLGGMCHDIGMLTLPAVGYDRKSYLHHPAAGVELLKKYSGVIFDGGKPQRMLVNDMAHYHHEQADGNGFPYGVKLSAIPMISNLCAIANEIDRILFDKANVKAPYEAVIDFVRENTGILFCGIASECFERTQNALLEVYVRRVDRITY